MSSRWISATQSMKLWSRIADIFRRDNCVHIFTSYWIMNSNMALTSVIGSYWWCCADTVEITTKHRMNRNWTQTLQKRAPGLARFHSFPIYLAKNHVFHQQDLRFSCEEWQEFRIKICRYFSIWLSKCTCFFNYIWRNYQNVHCSDLWFMELHTLYVYM